MKSKAKHLLKRLTNKRGSMLILPLVRDLIIAVFTRAIRQEVQLDFLVIWMVKGYRHLKPNSVAKL